MNRLWTTVFLLFFLAISPMLDLAFARYFFHGGAFPLHTPLYDFVYKFGPWPAFFVFGLSALLFVLGMCFSYFEKAVRPALFSILLIGLGPGLVIHGVLKECWGRPRPRMVAEFGGAYRFRPVYYPNLFPSTPMKSFPSGHSSMGFFFLGFVPLGRKYRLRWVSWLGLLLGLSLGGLIGAVRMAQGGHFFSDVVFSGVIVWLLANFLSRYLLDPLPQTA